MNKVCWRYWIGSVWICWFAFFGIACSSEPPRILPERAYRGAWFEKNDTLDVLSEQAKSSLRKMRTLGVRWLAIGPSVDMSDIHHPALSYGTFDTEYKRFIRYAKEQGFQVLLMPRIESPAFFEPPFPYRADIRMLTNDQWSQFHKNYLAMLIHYAKLAQESGVGLFVLGLEYRTYIRKFPQQWRMFAQTVRKHFTGKITYSANWFKEFEEVQFWDALDVIGIGAYFELPVQPSASRHEMREAWKPFVQQIHAISKRYNRPVVFTEAGFTSFSDAGQVPWKWQSDLKRPIDLNHQADCLDAMLDAFSNERWFEGLFLWRFYSTPGNAPAHGYNPIGKPIEDRIRSWFIQAQHPSAM